MPTFRKNIRRPPLNNEETNLSGITGSFIPTGDAVLKAGDTMTGPIIKKTRRITATDTILTTDDVVFCNTATAYTVTLPTGVEGQTFRIINSGTASKTLTVKPAAGQDLIGIADNSFLLYDGESLEITYNATDGWY